MSVNFSQVQRQGKVVSKAMIQTMAILRMNRAEMQEFLAGALERNPFVELKDGESAALGPIPQNSSDFLTDVPEADDRGIFRHVFKQLPYICYCARDYDIALAFVQELELSGWLGASVEEVAATSGFDLRDCEDMLGRLQTLDPAGLFARNLRECITLQAAERGQLDDTMRTIILHLDALRRLDPDQMAQRVGCDRAGLLKRVQYIRHMDPKPGARFDFHEAPSKSDDATVSMVDGELTVELNTSSFPEIRVLHLDTLKQSHDRHHRELRHLIEEARSLKRACELRNTTTLSLVSAMFMRQHAFLEAGFPALRPMRMHEIADDIGVSESTVSRILNGLTIFCGQRYVPARALFCNAVPYGDAPQTKHAAMHKIRQWITKEDKRFPLKDQEIVERLRETGLSISRRTVSKYRDELGLFAPGQRRKAGSGSMWKNR
ncbi:RNA polymerase factor sigma-54 [Roseobacter weihaiensis]|uniref:RNA polymerase factor sigma-54 n=1 Tax=Roseobacter weihaiensis TaxID=2763262 RepID=UPI001D09C7F0|nr:RNA polymerase sigma-54 factor [Roseobacter sp. H9]